MPISTIVKQAGITALLFILFVTAAPAQETVDTSQVYTLDEVIISASRWEQTPQSVGRNVTVITRQEIENSLYTSVGDLLAEQQSVHLVGNSQTPGSIQSIFLRNTDSNQSIIMIDGVRLSDPSTPGNSINLAELSLAGVERIEIVRGSHSTLYGSSAIGGVVNIITRTKSETGLNGSVETGHGTFGSGTYSMHNNLAANYSLENGLYVDLGIVQELTRGLDATVDTVSNPGIYNPQDRDDFNKLDMNGKVGYQAANFELFASYRRADQHNELDQSAFADDDNARIDFNRGLFNFGGSYKVSRQLEVNYSGAYSELGREFVNDSSVVDASGNYDGIYTETRGEGTLWENELTARIQADRITAVIGLGSSRQTMNSYNYTYSSTFDFESESDLDSLDLKEKIFQAFLYTEFNGGLLAHSLDAFTLGLGARLSDHDQFGPQWTYEINPKFQIGPASLVYGAFTTGFNAPSLYQLYSPAKGFGAYTSRGNSGLEPETSYSIEAGWKQGFGNRFHLEVSLFRTQVENAIEYIYLWDKNTPTGNLGSADYLGDTYINLSSQVTNGIEFGFQARILPRLRLAGNLSYSRSTSTITPGEIDDGYTGGHHVQIFEGGQFVDREIEVEGLIRRPQIAADAGLTYRPTDRLDLGLSTHFVGKNDDIYYSAALGPFGAVDRAEVDRYFIADLSAGYRLTSNLSLKVKVENLFNTDYSEIRGYKTRPRTIYGRVRVTL